MGDGAFLRSRSKSASVGQWSAGTVVHEFASAGLQARVRLGSHTLAEDEPLDEPVGKELHRASSTIRFSDMDMFDRAQQRLDQQRAEDRSDSGFFFYQKSHDARETSGPARGQVGSSRAMESPSTSRTTRALVVRGKSRLGRAILSLETSVNPRVAAMVERLHDSHQGPGYYDGIITRLNGQCTPAVPLHRIRTRQHQPLIDTSIGPTSYNAKDEFTRRLARHTKIHQAVYKTQNIQILKLLHRKDMTGPGSYEICEPNQHRGPVAFFPDTPRFSDSYVDRARSDGRPGPGAYNIPVPKASRAARFSQIEKTSSFEVRSTTPGPGYYDVCKSSKFGRSAGAAPFGTAGRFPGEGRVYLPMRRLTLRSLPPAADVPTESSSHDPIGDVDEADGAVGEPTATFTQEDAVGLPSPGSTLRIRVPQKPATGSPSRRIRLERARRVEEWRKRLVNRDFTALLDDSKSVYQPQEEQKRKIQMRWLKLMVSSSRASWFLSTLQLYHRNREAIQQLKRAVSVIQRWYRQRRRVRIEKDLWRKEQLYGRMVLRRVKRLKFRHILEKKHQAAEIIKVMLIFERRKLLKGVKTFRFKVMKLQSFWKKYYTMLQATAQVLELQFTRLEDRILGLYLDEEMKLAMTKAAKAPKKQVAGVAGWKEIRDEIILPKIAYQEYRNMLFPMARQKLREYHAAQRLWHKTKGDQSTRPYIDVILKPLHLLDLIKTAHDSTPDEVMNKGVKLKLQKFWRRLVQENSQ